MKESIWEVIGRWCSQKWVAILEALPIRKREVSSAAEPTAAPADTPPPTPGAAPDPKPAAAPADPSPPTGRWGWLKKALAIPVLALIVAVILAYKQWIDRPIAIETFTVVSGTDVSGISPAAIADQIKAHITRINADAGNVFEARKLGEATVPLDVKIADTGWTLANVAGALKIELTSAHVTGRISQVGKALIVQSTTSRGDRVWVDTFRISIPAVVEAPLDPKSTTEHKGAKEQKAATKPKKATESKATAEQSVQGLDGVEQDPFLTNLDKAAACLALRVMARASPEVAANYIIKQVQSDEKGSMDKEIIRRGVCIRQDDVELYSQVAQDAEARAAARVTALVGLSLHYSVKHEAYEELNMARAATDLVKRAIAHNEASTAYQWQRIACAILKCERGERIERAAIAAWMQQGAAYSDFASEARALAEATARRTSAIGAYKEALAIKKDYAQAYDAIGSQLAALGQTKLASDAFQQSIDSGETAAAHNDMGWLQINGRNELYSRAVGQAGFLDRAETEFLQAIRIEPDYWDAHSSLGYALYQNEKFKEAVDVLEPAVDHDGTNRDLWRLLGSSYAKLCRFADAKAKFEQAYEKYKEADDGNNVLNTLTDWGKVLDQFGLHTAAMAQEAEVLIQNKDHIYARQFLGQVEVANEDPKMMAKGLRDLKTAVDSDADKHDFVLESYLDGLVTARKPGEAIKVYEDWSHRHLVPPLAVSTSAGELPPRNQHVRLSYARALLRDKELKKALVQFETLRGVGIFPDERDVGALALLAKAPAGVDGARDRGRVEKLREVAITVEPEHVCTEQTMSNSTPLKKVRIH
jgi:tetratricopeptide (TPR) repeat protein